MTIIVGTVSNGHVYLGADARASHGELVRPHVHAKVWSQAGIVLGVSGRVREAQILEHLTTFPELPSSADDMLPWVCGPFIDAIRTATKTAGYDERIADQSQCEYGPVVLFGTHGRLFALHGDYSVAEYPGGGAVGSGQSVAWGSLHTSASMGVEDPRERIRLALEAACAHDAYCAPPFSYVTTEPESKS